MENHIRRAGIIGIGSAVPDKVLTNTYFETIVDTSDEWITSRTGIKERRIAPAEECASDLGARAAMAALENANLTPEDIDLIICATITGDMPFPATASVIQHKIGAKNAGAFDLSAGCSGFVYGIVTASGLVGAGVHNKVLVIGADLITRVIDFEDRATCVLFGDGAGAAVLAPADDGYGVLSGVLGSDGSGSELLMVPGGGSKIPASVEMIENRQQYLKMGGSEVFKFAVRILGDASVQALEKCGLTTDDVDLFIPHQANIRIIESAAKRLNLPPEKVFVNVQKYGNTSAASIPIAIDEAAREGKLKKDDVLVIVGFGAGLTWAASVIKWGINGKHVATK
jgi:3-oxoacyl-[acyl-carrier-protein] synthase-3